MYLRKEIEAKCGFLFACLDINSAVGYQTERWDKVNKPCWIQDTCCVLVKELILREGYGISGRMQSIGPTKKQGEWAKPTTLIAFSVYDTDDDPTDG